MPRAARDYERAALASGAILVDPDGRVWRTRSRGRPCAPYRVDGLGADGFRAVYCRVGDRRARVLAHRLVWTALRGPIPQGMLVKHRTSDRGDNRLPNLYLARPSASFDSEANAATGAAAATGVSDPSGGSAVSS